MSSLGEYQFDQITDKIVDQPDPEAGLEGLFARMTEAGSAAAGVEDLEKLLKLREPIDSDADEILKEYLRAPLSYSPFQVEYLTKTLVEHVRNCMDLRRQCQELEIAAFDQHLTLFLGSQNIDAIEKNIDLDKFSRPRVMASLYNPVHDKASGAIASGTNADKFSNAKTLIEKAILSTKRNELFGKTEFAKIPGGAANYLYRIDLIRQLFSVELVEAYRRANSVASGLRSIYQLDEEEIRPLPEPKGTGYLNDLAVWTREASYLLERIILRRHESIAAVVLGEGAATAGHSIVTPEDFKAGRSDGKFKFDLTEEKLAKVLPGAKAPLLRGLELALWGSKRDNLADWQPLRATITLAEREIMTEAGESGFKYTPSLSLSDVAMMNRRPYGQLANDQIHNISPIGAWDVEINRSNLFADKLNDASTFSHLVIFMRLSHE